MSYSEELRRFFLAGIGAMATTAEKSKEIVDAFVRKGELTVEQGRIINEELKRDVKKTVSQAEDTVKGMWKSLWIPTLPWSGKAFWSNWSR